MTRGLRQRNGTCNVPGWSVTAKPGTAGPAAITLVLRLTHPLQTDGEIKGVAVCAPWRHAVAASDRVPGRFGPLDSARPRHGVLFYAGGSFSWHEHTFARLPDDPTSDKLVALIERHSAARTPSCAGPRSFARCREASRHRPASSNLSMQSQPSLTRRTTPTITPTVPTGSGSAKRRRATGRCMRLS